MRVPPVVLLAFCAALASALAKYLPIMSFSVPNWIVVLGLLAGAILLLPAVISFVKHKTTVSPLSPSEATTLVTNGIFRISRNPMYVGMQLMLLALSLWFQTLSSLFPVVLFFIMIDRFQIKIEEKQLLKKFGETYRDYAQRVPRWLIIRGGVLKNE